MDIDTEQIQIASKKLKISIKEEQKGNLREAHDILEEALEIIKTQMALISSKHKKKEILNIMYTMNHKKLISLKDTIK